jgi:acetylornithine deacetylase/succinyl-diaminopimelate desuccinylase family protein
MVPEMTLPSATQKLLESLVRIDSVNPSLDSAGGGEKAIGGFIADFCRERNLEFKFQDVEGERRNILAWVPGSSDERLLFVAHMDTVPVKGWQRDPFEPVTVGNKLYGRGACDTKASLVAMLLALDSIKRERPRATIVVAGSVDEEFQKKGARALGEIRPLFSGAVVGEPTDLEVVVAHKGSVRWQIETIGRAAHSSMPENGANAIMAMAETLLALKTLGDGLRAKSTPLTGAPSLTVSMIEGGTDICTMPARCVISVDRRLVPGESAGEALQQVETVLKSLTQKNSEIRVRSILPAAEDPPVSGVASTPLASVVHKACSQYAGTGEFRGVPYGTDGSRLSAAGIPCIIVGPGSIEQAHTVDEFVELSQLDQAFDIYRSVMLHF